MKLVLAEKPSVAQSIAKVLGAAKREDGYLEGNGYVVSWCVGHLVELAQPEVYDAKYSKWAYADLPIFPMDWQYEVSAGTKKQFGILKKLMAREDVASLVCATDAGREGELIFRLVYHKAGCRKPFERLWISSMEDVAIKEGFENLRSGTEYDALYEAALCRERADWIVGINATRLFSTLYGQTLNVGRVMTPTLAMAVMREAAISAFKPELFYTVQIGLDGFTAASERFKTKAAAEAVKQSCSVAIVQKAECKEKTEKPPALYDLTSLQREANRVLGYTAQQTLDYTQNLYEKKLVTYPRTDSRFLTEDMAHSLTDLVKLAFHTFPVEDVDKVPVIISVLKDDEAVVSMVDSNLQREMISPSEKAFAYKMKYEAIKRKAGRRKCGQVDHNLGKKSIELIGEECGDSPKQVQRYIKITELIPEMLEKVDDGSMGFTPAVQLSFLKKKEQKEMLDAMEFAQCTPSLSQALRIKKLSADGKLTVRDMEDILSEIKQKEIDSVVFKTEQLHRFFPVSYTAEQMRREILEMLKLNMNKYWDE